MSALHPDQLLQPASQFKKKSQISKAIEFYMTATSKHFSSLDSLSKQKSLFAFCIKLLIQMSFTEVGGGGGEWALYRSLPNTSLRTQFCDFRSIYLITNDVIKGYMHL